MHSLLQNEEHLQGERFMEYYARNWERFQLITKVLHGLCDNLNANWIRRNRTEGRLYIHQINVVSSRLEMTRHSKSAFS